MAEGLPKASEFPPGTEFVIKEFDVPLANVPGQGWINWYGGRPRAYQGELRTGNHWRAESFEQWLAPIEDSMRS